MEEPTSQPIAQPVKAQSSLGIPIAIVISSALIAAAIFFSGNSDKPSNPIAQPGGPTGQEQVTPEITVEPVTSEDHIRGNPNAPIMLIEYSDYDCPFCKNFHETMNQVMLEYGTDGKVAWVYRHFPLEGLHPNAPAIAAAAECVAELGGDQAFWTFSDQIFEERGQNELTNINRLGAFAATAGVSQNQFDLCYNSGKYDEAIEEDIAEAIAAGGRGTPYTIVMVGNQQGVINGAQPYSYVKQVIDTLLAQIEGGEIEIIQEESGE